MRQSAASFAGELAQWAKEVSPQDVTELEKELGEQMWQNIALYFEQTRVLPEERKELIQRGLGDIVTLLNQAHARAGELHSDYVKILYTEFDAVNAPLGGSGIQEVYLGRDGVYMFWARQEMLAAYRERGDERATRHVIDYLSVSRAAKWRERDRHLLEDMVVMVDTGFSGSIPDRVARNQGMELKRDNEPLRAGQLAVRLLSTERENFGFTWQASRDSVYDIEYDAKATVSARYVGDRTPAGAVEQLIFRQLEDSARHITRAQMRQLLAMEERGQVDIRDLDTQDFGGLTRLPPATSEAKQEFSAWVKLSSKISNKLFNQPVKT